MECECVSSHSEDLTGSAWQDALRRRLPLLGHRNWIVIADSAYPAQCAPGITTMLVDGNHLDIVRQVLAMIAASGHVKPRIHNDSELKCVSELDAPGVSAYRSKLAELPRWSEVHSMPHEEIIDRIDSAATKFEVLVIKTPLTIPYTSVFLELDCAYWNDGAEARLRATMNS
jgi:hypothetical protein